MIGIKLLDHLDLSRCPHCGIAHPNLQYCTGTKTSSHDEQTNREWKVYVCSRCGGCVIAAAYIGYEGFVEEYYPKLAEVNEAIPDPARSYLQQAIESLHAPSGSVMLSASAVDAMLKAKNYKKGTLYARIEQAAKERVITEDMATWAHEIRLDANDPRHADEKSPLPSEEGARRCVDFATALGEFMFVLPSRVKRGLKAVGVDAGGAGKSATP